MNKLYLEIDSLRARLTRYEEVVKAARTLIITAGDDAHLGNFDPVYVDDLTAALAALDEQEKK
jgi:hypothetical protein